MRSVPFSILTAVVIAVLAPGPVAAQDDLPSAEVVLERYHDAIGAEALTAYTHQTIKGVLRAIGSGEGTFPDVEIATYRARPDRMLSVMDMGFYGITRTGHDGETAWIESHGQVNIFLDEERAAIAAAAAVFSPLVPPGEWAGVATTGRTTFADRPAFRLSRTTASGEKSWFFDTETGLLLGRVEPDGTRFRMEDYEARDGVLFPRTTRVTPEGQPGRVMTLTQVSHEPFDDVSFAPPATDDGGQ